MLRRTNPRRWKLAPLAFACLFAWCLLGVGTPSEAQAFRPIPSPCGDGKCDDTRGENCTTCAKDCPCKSGRTCNKGVCGGGGVPPNPCGDGQCNNGENCSTCAKDCACSRGLTCDNGTCKTPTNCGNNKCEADKGENCSTCGADCGCNDAQVCNGGKCIPAGGSCGNGQCDNGENCSTCPKDCPCEGQATCKEGKCDAVRPSPCGDGKCDETIGENCGSCAKDCACGGKETCKEGKCTNADPIPPDASPQDNAVADISLPDPGPQDTGKTQDTGSTQDSTVADNKSGGNDTGSGGNDNGGAQDNGGNKNPKSGGCGCQSTPMTPTWLFLILGLGFLITRRQRRWDQ